MDYEYHAGTGKHILMKSDPDVNRPTYSVVCFLHYLCDCIALSLVVGFLGFAGWLCYYILNNYGDGGR
jgi:hypothetical protein